MHEIVSCGLVKGYKSYEGLFPVFPYQVTLTTVHHVTTAFVSTVYAFKAQNIETYLWPDVSLTCVS